MPSCSSVGRRHTFGRSWILGSAFRAKALRYSRSDRAGGDLLTRSTNRRLRRRPTSERVVSGGCSGSDATKVARLRATTGSEICGGIRVAGIRGCAFMLLRLRARPICRPCSPRDGLRHGPKGSMCCTASRRRRSRRAGRIWNWRRSDLGRLQGEVMRVRKVTDGEHGPRHVTPAKRSVFYDLFPPEKAEMEMRAQL